MKNAVQILLLCSMLPALGVFAQADDASLEERKRRVMRKYLREEGAITKSEEVVPSDLPDETARVMESEKRGSLGDSFAAEESMGGMPMPRAAAPRPMPRAAATDHWLLRDNGTEGDDMGAETDASMGRDAWTSWDSELQPAGSARDGLNSRTRGGADTYGARDYSNPRAGVTTGNARGGAYGSGPTWGARSATGRSAPGTAGYSPYGASREGSTLGEMGTRGTYGMDSGDGLLTSPYARSSAPRRAGGTDSSLGLSGQSRYQPPQNSYEADRERRSQQWSDALEDRSKTPEYKRPDSYQQWKKSTTPSWDPTSDDAYLRGAMPSGKSGR